jgi:hypothetical protein
MDYGAVLGRAWDITWRWKVLWVLGFLASLGRALAWSGNSRYGFNERSGWGTTYGPSVAPRIVGLLVAVACLAILIAIAVWVISVMARGGLIAGVQQVEDEDRTSFLQAWRVGRGRFWTLFGITVLAAIPSILLILAGLAVFGLLIFLTVQAMDASEAAGVAGIVASVLCGGTLCCGTILLAAVLQQIRIYAERAAILEGLGWIDAFSRGWHVLRENLGPTIVLWLVFLIISIVVAVLLFGSLAAIVAPFIALFTNIRPGIWIVAPICFGGLLAIIVFALIQSIYEAFSSATWTLAYRELTGLVPQSPIQPATEP